MRYEQPEYDELTLLRRQMRFALRSLLRPRTYLGTVRELALTGAHVAAYPLGMVRSGGHRSTPMGSLDPDAGAVDDATLQMPVLLVHGYVHNRSAFLGMSRALRRAGFRHVHAFDYDPISVGIPVLAGMLASEVDRVLAVTRAERCMLVGHSMGGVISRYYVQQLGGSEKVDTVITLGTPHRGTMSAYLGLGAGVRQLRPGSALMRRLQETARPSDVRWIALYSDLDLLVLPATSAKITHPALAATNIRLTDHGHMALLLSGEALRHVVAHLCDRTLHRSTYDGVAELAGRRREALHPVLDEAGTAGL